MRTLLLIVAGVFVGWFDESPVTVIAACAAVGSLVVWSALMLLGRW